MAMSIAATVPYESAARKLGEWLGKIVHRVQIEKTGTQWSIVVPEAALSRARRALREVIVAANPPPHPGGACCKTLGTGKPCAKCRKHSHFTVDWILPGRVQDQRPACSSACAIALKKSVSRNPEEKRYNVWAYNRLTGGSFELERNVTAKEAVKAYREARKQGLRPWCIDLTTRNEVHPTRSGVLKNPARTQQWKGGQDAFGQGQRAGAGYVRFWLWNDREWKLNLRSSYDGVGGEPSLRQSAQWYADEEAQKKGIAKKFPSQVGKWKAGFILSFEKAIAAYFGPKREFSQDIGDYKDSADMQRRAYRRLAESKKRMARRNPSAKSAWDKMTGRQRMHTLMAAGIDYEVAEMQGNRRWDLLPSVWRQLVERNWENTGSSRGTTKRIAQATSNPSKAVREARIAKVQRLLVRIKAILQAGEQHLRMGRRKEALESSRRANALWDQMPKGVAMVAPQTRREAYELSQRGLRLRNGQVFFSGYSRNPGGRYLIQAIRPKHRNWVTIDVRDELNRALLDALHRARLGNVTYRVWDTEEVQEVWRGAGKEASIEGWKATRPSGLVGANRRMAMHRNPRISASMMPLRENTMRLGDAMKYGRALLDAGVQIHLWDGSGWEVDIKPDDSYSTSSGHAAKGGRRYLSQGAGLIKRWPITLMTPKVAPGVWMSVAAVRHFLQHRRAGVASNPGACGNPICKKNPWYYGYKKGGGVEKFHSRLKPTEASHGGRYGAVVGPFKTPQAMEKMYGFGWQAGPHTIVQRGKVSAAYNGRTLRTGIYCTMCGADKKEEGPFHRPKVGPQKGKIICDLCYRGWRSGRRMGEPWAKNHGVRRNQGDAGDNPRIAHEEIVGAFLAGRPKKIGPRYWTDGQLLRVWGNLVAKKVPGGVDIMDAGWRTLLTRNVLNTVLRHLGGGNIYQSKHQWYISTPTGKVSWPGEWTIPIGGAAANRGRRVHHNGRGETLTIADIDQWIDNDEGLYNWWRRSRQSKRDFIRENRAELEASIQRVLNRPPAHMNPRVRAWDIIAYIPGKPERWVMQSGHKDKKRALEIAKIYQGIALKEMRKHKYVVRPFRYSDWQTRMKKNPLTQKEVDQLRRNETFFRMGQRIEVRAGNTKDAMQLQGAMQESRVIRQMHRAPGVKFRPGPQGLTLREIDALPPATVMKNPTSNAWNVYLDGRLIDTVFYSASAKVTADEVKRSLVGHDGYDPNIVVRRTNRFSKKNPLTRRETANVLRASRAEMAASQWSSQRYARTHRMGKAMAYADVAAQYGPKSARRHAAIQRAKGAIFPKSNPGKNPQRRKHLGLNGLMSNSDAKNAMRFA